MSTRRNLRAASPGLAPPMTTLATVVLLGMAGAVVVLQLVLLFRKAPADFSPLQKEISTLATLQERMEHTIREELARNRTESGESAREGRQELAASIKSVSDSLTRSLAAMSEAQARQQEGFSAQLASLTESNQGRIDSLKESVDARLKSIQQDNARQLDQMRTTVDEKLQSTLEKRLGESFRLVSDRLESVHKGLGEMQTLATGVGDLKKVLTNVKTRGTWGEVQLGAMLEQVLSPGQYALNVAVKDGGERVEFAIKLPGRNDAPGDTVWLPIDSKFPIEDYQRLLEAQEKADPEAADLALKNLETRIKQCAREISAKYLAPPKSTDFGILYLPTEGLFAEVIRRTGLPEHVQRESRVVIAGPTTLWSILNSLQMGFRTLAIQERSSEVWKVLGAVKNEFGKFGSLLDGVKKKLDAASNHIEDISTKSRTIERKLRNVQDLPATQAAQLLGMDTPAGDDSGDPEDETTPDP